MSSDDTTARNASTPERVNPRRAVAPPVDIFENPDELLLVADLPGVAKEDVTIHFERGQLTLEARRSDKQTGNLLATEYRAFDYKRAFALPQGIDAEKISAKLESGVLRVHLPKAAALKPRRIEVKAS